MSRLTQAELVGGTEFPLEPRPRLCRRCGHVRVWWRDTWMMFASPATDG